MWGQVRYKTISGPKTVLINRASDLQNVCISPTKCVHPTYKIAHPTYKSCALTYKSFLSDIQKLCIRPTKCVHPTYTNCASDLQKLCIPPTKVVHPTYKSYASYLQKMCIRPTEVCNQLTNNWATDQQQVRYTIFFFNRVGIRHIVHIGPRAAEDHLRVGPKYRRTDVTLDGSNTITSYWYNNHSQIVLYKAALSAQLACLASHSL